MITRWPWFGAGVTAAGIAVTGWAYADWLSAPSEPGQPVVAGLVFGLGVLMMIPLVLTLVSAFRYAWRRESLRDFELDLLNREISYARRQAWRRAVLQAVLGAYGWSQAPAAFEDGFPELGVVGFAAGQTVVVAGLVVAAIRLRGTAWMEQSVGGAAPATAAGAGPGSPGGADEGVEPGASVGAGRGKWPVRVVHVVAGAVGGLGVGAVAVLAAFLAVTLLPVDAVTAERAVKPSAAIPAAVSRVAWEWEAPSLIQNAVPAGPGVVVRVRDGVVALDTATGLPRWHYRRPGAYAGQLFGAPDGGTVIVTFSVTNDSTRVVTLDAYTGKVRSQRDRSAGGMGGFHGVALTSRGFAQQSGPSELVGFDLDEHRVRWLYELPDDCRFAGDSKFARYVALRDVIAVMLMCRPDENLHVPCPRDDEVDMKIRVVALDPADGRQVWRQEHLTSADPSSLDIRAAADGDALAVLTGGQDFLLSQADGKVIGDLDLDALPYHLEEQRTAFDGYVGFGADGLLTTDRKKPGPKSYRWEPFGAGEQKQVSLPKPPDLSQWTDTLPLRDVLLWTIPLMRGKETASMTVVATRWDTGETVRFPDVVEFVYHRGEGRLPWPRGAPLLETPGAITVVQGDGSKVVGLAG
ncbi:PQQ-binding-like beta-propeller repeat protein [Nonomuraea purpurea]|uniref:PQQ-binding-like beta-propeller repeat protein n=1 Tax=Nonomuraea purpurea TaxID=1849276 RepID=A0ABV8G950_9ACTN